jgi:hypothetical protein
MYALEVLHPVASLRGDVEGAPPAPRSKSLQSKRVGLVWNAKRGGEIALDRVGELLQERFKGVTVKRYDGGFPNPKTLLQQAIAENDVLVGTTGD